MKKSLTVVLFVSLGLGGCAFRKVPDTRPRTASETTSATYKGRYSSEGGDHRRFRAWVWAVPPDRIHVEIYGPMGGTRLLMDGGGGQLVVLFPGDRIAYGGESGERDLSPLLGVRLSLEELVAALTGAKRPPGLDIWERSPLGQAGLPDRLTVGVNGAVLELEMLKSRPLPDQACEKLGKGESPAGWRTRPLADLLTEVVE